MDNRRQNPFAANPSSPDAALAAVRIQAAVRGLLARKTVKSVATIEAEVDQIQTSIVAAAASADDEQGTVRTDDREKLRVGESLMRILFRLDSVRGARDYRKRVVKKVVFLQDLVDCIDGKSSKSESCDFMDSDSGEVQDGIAAMNSVDDSKTSDECVVEEFGIRDSVNSGISVADEHSENRFCSGVLEEEDGFVLLSVEECSDARSVVPERTAEGEHVIVKAAGKVDSGVDEGFVIDVMAENEKLLQAVKDLCNKQSRMLSELVDRVERLENIVKRMEERKIESCN